MQIGEAPLMSIVLIIVGALATVVGLIMVIKPSQAADFEERISPSWLRGTIPRMWEGREAARSRFAGAALALFGAILFGCGIAFPS